MAPLFAQSPGKQPKPEGHDTKKIVFSALGGFYFELHPLPLGKTPNQSSLAIEDKQSRELRVIQFNDTSANRAENLTRVQNLFDAIRDPLGPQTASDYFHFLTDQAPLMNQETKLLFLSALGSRLSASAHRVDPKKALSFEEVYQNMRLTGQEGGVCRDVGRFIKSAALALGFTDAGQTTALWDRSLDSNPNSGPVLGGGHLVAFYRDPETQEIFIQNYQTVFNSRETNIAEASEIASRVLGPLSSFSRVETESGRIHILRSRTALWLSQLARGSASFDGIEPIRVNIDASSHKDLRISIGGEIERKRFGFKLFVTGETAHTQEGSYDVLMGGVAGQIKVLGIRDDSPFHLDLRGILGALSLTVPRLSPDPTLQNTRWSRSNLFMEAQIEGQVKIVQGLSGQLLFELSAYDFDGTRSSNRSTYPFMRGTAAILFHSKNNLLSGDLSHSLIYKDVDQTYLNRAWKGHQKRIHFLVDTRALPHQVYLIADTKIYLLDGSLTNPLALGLIQKLKIGLPLAKLGDVYLVYEEARIDTRNSGTQIPDPLYVHTETLRNFGFGIDSIRLFKGGPVAGLEISRQKGRIPLVLAEPEDVYRPDLGAFKEGAWHLRVGFRYFFKR